MAKKKYPITGCLFLILLAIGAGVQLFKYNPVAGVAGVIAIIFFGGLLLYAMRRKRCEVCGNFLERKKYFWTIEAKRRGYARIAIKHSCEGRVELQHAI
jgi:hypothetical protein